MPANHRTALSSRRNGVAGGRTCWGQGNTHLCFPERPAWGRDPRAGLVALWGVVRGWAPGVPVTRLCPSRTVAAFAFLWHKVEI